MNVARTIAGRPVRTGDVVARSIIDLVAATLDTSPHLTADGVRDELASAVPALSLLASGGYLANGDVVLAAADLRLTINVPVDEKALAATENDSPPRGAATATDWSLHLPAPNGLADISEAAAIACSHVSTDPPPAESASQATASAAAIDLSRLANRSNR